MGSFRSRKRKQNKPEPNKPHAPNKVSGKRYLLLFIAIWAGVGGYTLITENKVAFPLQGGPRYGNRGDVFYMYDEKAYVLYLGLILMSISFLTKIIDHFDKRDNEKIYKAISKNTWWAGIVACVMSIALEKI